MPNSVTLTETQISNLETSLQRVAHLIDKLDGVVLPEHLDTLHGVNENIRDILRVFWQERREEENARDDELWEAWKQYEDACTDMHLPLDSMPDDIVISSEYQVKGEQQVCGEEVNGKFAIFAVYDDRIYIRFFDYSLTALQVALMFSESRRLLDDKHHYFYEGLVRKRADVVKGVFTRIANERNQDNVFRDGYSYYEMASGS